MTEQDCIFHESRQQLLHAIETAKHVSFNRIVNACFQHAVDHCGTVVHEAELVPAINQGDGIAFAACSECCCHCAKSAADDNTFFVLVNFFDSIMDTSRADTIMKIKTGMGGVRCNHTACCVTA